jgi:archaellum component FlaC
MEDRMKRIEDKLDTILELLENNKRVQTKLENHIEFIERTYETLHSPLTYVKNSVNRLMGKASPELEHVK